MSGQSPMPSCEPLVTDAIVLAGARNTKPFRSLSGALTPKPLLPVGGQALLLRSVRAALGARGVDRVYVVGDLTAIGRVLEPNLRRSDRLRLVPEGEDLADNCRRVFFGSILPDRGFPAADPSADALEAYRVAHPDACRLRVLVLTADMPFVDPVDVEEFLQAAPLDAALVVGLCDHAELERMQRDLGATTVLDRWKLGAFPLRQCDVRLNNLWLSRPLMISPRLHEVLNEIYANRWLFDQSGRVLWRNWWAILRSVSRHALRAERRGRFLRGLLNAAGAALAASLARALRRLGRPLAWPFRQFVSRRDIEFWSSMLLNAPARLLISASVAPAIDIDVEECYLALVADNEESCGRIARYLGRAPAGAGPSLRLVV